MFIKISSSTVKNFTRPRRESLCIAIAAMLQSNVCLRILHFSTLAPIMACAGLFETKRIRKMGKAKRLSKPLVSG
jgi:hypothetical protein